MRKIYLFLFIIAVLSISEAALRAQEPPEGETLYEAKCTECRWEYGFISRTGSEAIIRFGSSPDGDLSISEVTCVVGFDDFVSDDVHIPSVIGIPCSGSYRMVLCEANPRSVVIAVDKCWNTLRGKISFSFSETAYYNEFVRYYDERSSGIVDDWVRTQTSDVTPRSEADLGVGAVSKLDQTTELPSSTVTPDSEIVETTEASVLAELRELKRIYESGLISEAEYKSLRMRVLGIE